MVSSKSSKQSCKLQKFAGDVVTATVFTLAAILQTSLKAKVIDSCPGLAFVTVSTRTGWRTHLLS